MSAIIRFSLQHFADLAKCIDLDNVTASIYLDLFISRQQRIKNKHEQKIEKLKKAHFPGLFCCWTSILINLMHFLRFSSSNTSK